MMPADRTSAGMLRRDLTYVSNYKTMRVIKGPTNGAPRGRLSSLILGPTKTPWGAEVSAPALPCAPWLGGGGAAAARAASPGENWKPGENADIHKTLPGRLSKM